MTSVLNQIPPISQHFRYATHKCKRIFTTYTPSPTSQYSPV
jgi:hypothetical protein